MSMIGTGLRKAGVWSPCIGVAPWGILDEELHTGMQSAHKNGVAYEVQHARCMCMYCIHTA